MKTADASGVTVTLTSPSGLISTSDHVPCLPPTAPRPRVAYAPLAWGNEHGVAACRSKPTIASSGLVPEHGDWTIRVAGVPAHMPRSTPMWPAATRTWACARAPSVRILSTLSGNKPGRLGQLHARRRGVRQGRVTDPSRRHPQRHRYRQEARARRRWLLILRTDASRLIRRQALRATARSLASVPDYVLPCDESYALQGIRAGGNRSGSVFRLMGTSTAAPQLARHVTNPPLPVPYDMPTTLEDIRKRGGGDLDPP